MADPVVVKTIGYQGRAIADFLDVLRDSNVDIVVDVRSKPISRRHDYSKTRLAAHLDSRGIDYRHMPQLGMPIDLLDRRDEKTGNAAILAIYREWLTTRSGFVEDVGVTARSVTVCLLCYEANPMHCHRSVLTDALVRQGKLEVEHL